MTLSKIKKNDEYLLKSIMLQGLRVSNKRRTARYTTETNQTIRRGKEPTVRVHGEYQS